MRQPSYQRLVGGCIVNRSRIGEAMSGKMNVRYGIMGTYMMMGDGRHVDLGV